MATDTVPAAVPGPPDPPGHTATAGQDPKGGLLASMVAPVEPARPTFDLTPTPGSSANAAGPDGALDQSAPGVSSATFRDTTEQAAKEKDPAGARHKRSVWKEMWLAAATRWAKGGGVANKRLDLKKAKAQAHQVKEARTITVTKLGGLPVRNSGGSGAGVNKGSGKPDGKTPGKGSTNSSGNRSNGAGSSSGGSGGGRGPGGSGSGGRGPGGGSGSNGSGAGGRGGKERSSKDTVPSGKGSTGAHRGPAGTGGGTGKGAAGDGDKKGPAKTDTPSQARKDGAKQTAAGGGTGAGGGAGKPGAAGKSGKDGSKKTAAGPDDNASSGKADLTKTPKNGNGKQQHASEKTPLQKSRETGHGDGTKTRRAVDHVKAYVDGARDGWDDEKTKNAKEHDRLDKAHTTHQPKAARTAGAIVTEKGDDGVTTDVKPLTVQNIDANTLTLGTDSARTSVGRRELRNFKQYERKLEAKETVLQQISEACVQLKKEAENEAKDCQDLADQAKNVEGGEKLKATLIKLADDSKNQATEAAELAQQARKAAEMCKVVLTNIQTRYAPLYKAVVDSDETKPAELRFYNDKGTYAPAA